MNLRQLLTITTKRLNRYSSSPALDAEILLSLVLKKPREFLYSHPEYKVNQSLVTAYQLLVTRRLKGVPVAYLTGQQEFYGLNFLVNKNTLIPRPDTELLIDEVLRIAKSYRLSAIGDIATGSGCIAVTLAKHLPQAKIYATDISRPALKVAEKNARLHGVKGQIKFKQGNLLEPLKNIKLDILIANLPYLTAAEVKNEPSIQAEPRQALLGGPDGLKLFRQLFSQLAARRQKPRLIFLEIGCDQAPALKLLAQKHLPAYRLKIKTDLAGRDRVIILTKNKRS
ncbi:MAG: peptide chain release factor N(5)-glutamine methyltransferase [Patescibacteria group bacterium]|jgi:release factor glutamine methyltransferase